jgi:hypothetical protein
VMPRLPGVGEAAWRLNQDHAAVRREIGDRHHTWM